MSSRTVQSHAPPGYACPFCLLAAGVVSEHVWSHPADIVYQDAEVLAFVAAGQFSAAPAYPGHVLIVPVQHIENLYDLPDLLAARIHALSRRVALAFKALGCEGVSTRQHNEPAGNQDVWHIHLHIFPRWMDDDLYAARRVRIPEARRVAQAEQLRPVLAQIVSELPLP